MNSNRLAGFVVMCAILVTLAAPVRVSAEPISAQNAGKVQRLAQLKGHTGPVFSMAFSPSGRLLVSGGSAADHSVRTWDVPGGAQRGVLSGNEKQVAAVAFSADGSHVISAGYDGTIRTFEATQGKQLGVINRTADQGVLTIENLVTAFNGDGTKFVYSNDTGQGPYLFDVSTRKQIDLAAAVPGSHEYIGPIAVNGAGSLLAVSAGTDGTIYVIDLKTAKQTAVLKPSEASEGGGAMAFSRDGALLAVSIDGPSDIQLYDVASKKPAALLTGHKKNTNGTLAINGLAFSFDHKLLASSSFDKTIRLWDTASGKLLATLDASSGSGPCAVAWSPDGSIVASADLNGAISLWGIR